MPSSNRPEPLFDKATRRTGYFDPERMAADVRADNVDSEPLSLRIKPDRRRNRAAVPLGQDRRRPAGSS